MANRNTKANLSIPIDISKNYLLARSDIFYFLQFINYENELYNNPSSLSSKPNIIFYTENNINRIILDYSAANITDKTYLKSFFTNMNQLNGLTLTNGSYLEESKNIIADLSSTLVFDEYKNNYIFASVTSTINKNTASDVYMADFLINTPQLISNVNLGQNETNKKSAMVCISVGGKLLNDLSIFSGDVIEIINEKSQNNSQRFLVIDTVIINNKQIIVLKQPAISENLTGSPSIVNLFVEPLGTTTNNVTLNLTDTIYGSCAVSSGIVLKNSTKYQCQLRRGNWIKS